MSLYVLDAEALGTLPQRIQSAHRVPVLVLVTDAVSNREACFPPEVSREAKRLADEADQPWVYALSAAVRIPEVPFEFVMEANERCPDLADIDVPFSKHEPSVVYVIAAALMLASNHSVTIVTDEILDPPERISLTSAAQAVGIPTMTLEAFLLTLPGCHKSMLC